MEFSKGSEELEIILKALSTKALLINSKPNPEEGKAGRSKPNVSEKKTFEFLIAGLPYKLRSSHDEETVQELVQFVDQKIQQAMQATRSGSLQSAAVLTALNIAEELILLKKRARREIEKIEERALKLSQDLENSKADRNGMQTQV